jgi:hypothetical protein
MIHSEAAVPTFIGKCDVIHWIKDGTVWPVQFDYEIIHQMTSAR